MYTTVKSLKVKETEEDKCKERSNKSNYASNWSNTKIINDIHE